MPSSQHQPQRGSLHTDTGPRTVAPEDTLKTETLHIERKTFVFSLKENPRGRFLRITEEVGSRRDQIIVPTTGLTEFKRVLEMIAQADRATAAKAQQP